MLTWLQLGIHRKPCGILNIEGYYDALIALTAHGVAEGFIAPAHKEMLVVQDTVQQLISELIIAPLPVESKWVSNRER